MNLENFKEVYLKTISESTDDSDLKNWIRSIVEEILNEEKYDLTKDAKKLLDIFDEDPSEFQKLITNYPEWNKWISEIAVEDNLHPDDDFEQIQNLAIAKLDKLWKKNN